MNGILKNEDLMAVAAAAARLNVLALSDGQLRDELSIAQKHNPTTGFMMDTAAAIAIGEERKRRQEARRHVEFA